MQVHTFSSREFTRDVSAAKRAAAEGPVFITDRGRPAFALLSIEEYHRIVGRQEASLLEVMDNGLYPSGATRQVRCHQTGQLPRDEVQRVLLPASIPAANGTRSCARISSSERGSMAAS